MIESLFPPVATPESVPFWEGLSRRELWLPVCDECQRAFFYPRSFCPRCHARTIHWERASGRGTLLSATIAERPLPGIVDEAPYVVAVVGLEEGPQLMANLQGIAMTPDAITLDMPLRCAYRSAGDMVVPIFEPDEARA
jgi:uncharacterized protein